MDRTMNQADLNAAMRGFVRGRLERHPVKDVPFDVGRVAAIAAMREGIRAEEGGGGMCHLVTEALAHERGWGRLAVSYLATDGVIVSDGHYVNLLGDGSILDATADQFGEGHGVRLLRPDDPEYGRYRPEFDDDYNPDTAPELAAWKPAWNGETDWDAHIRVAGERGYGWWLDDPRDMLAYLAQRRAHAEADQFSIGDVRLLDRWVEEIETRFGAGGLAP